MSRGKTTPDSGLQSDTKKSQESGFLGENTPIDTIDGEPTDVSEEVVSKKQKINDVDDKVIENDEVLEDQLKPQGKKAQRKSSEVAGKKSRGSKKRTRFNPIAKIVLFLRQVIAEMKKVHWITRKQSVVYTIVVLTFVVCCVAYVAGLDVLFQYLMGLIFGNIPRGVAG